jgi:4-hydroxy-tetrahydrodipicolinate reductase
MGTINLAIAGATGWAGSAIADGALAAPDITLKAAIARSSAGQDLGSALGRERLGVPVYANVGEALDGVDVLAEFTSHTHAKQIALAAIERGVAVVIGSSGLTADDFQEVDEAARAAGVGAVAAGNFSLTAAMMLAGAELAARHLAHWEVIDYAKSSKPDAPSGTARELAERLAEVRAPQVDLRSTRSPATRTRAARTSPAPRSTPSASRASSCPPRSSSAPTTSASASVTTPAAPPRHT